jgi:flavin-dependent dehydrogenase
VKQNIETDIVIVGAGVAGCIAAIALSTNYSVLLVDKLSTPIPRVGECLPPAARRILKQLGLLAEFETEVLSNLSSIGMQSYWGSEQLQIVDHISNPDGLGWHLDRQAFEVFLRDQAIQRGVEVLWPAKLVASEFAELNWQLSIQPLGDNDANQMALDSHQISAKFVIDAGGRLSPFAKLQGEQRQPFDHLISCWATIPNTIKNKMGVICAVEKGWWYSAPLPNQQRVVALQTDSDLITRGLNKDGQLFLQQAKAIMPIAKVLGSECEQIKLHGIASANSTRLNQVAGIGWVALGDAATSFDPLSSQGMYNAMACAMQLSDLLKVSGLIKSPNVNLAQQVQMAYSGQIEQIWHYYVQHKNVFYGQERRWTSSPFWSRRQ